MTEPEDVLTVRAIQGHYRDSASRDVFLIAGELITALKLNALRKYDELKEEA